MPRASRRKWRRIRRPPPVDKPSSVRRIKPGLEGLLRGGHASPCPPLLGKGRLGEGPAGKGDAAISGEPFCIRQSSYKGTGNPPLAAARRSGYPLSKERAVTGKRRAGPD